MDTLLAVLFSPFTPACALVATAGAMIMTGGLSLRRPAETELWPVTEGMVLESTVASSNDHGRQIFRPEIHYRYEIGGERFEGHRIQWDLPAGFRKYTRARTLLDGYRAGTRVAVYYDPQRPGIAVLQRGHGAARGSLMLVAPTAALYAIFTVGTFIGG
jgi:hypothetical protein